MSEAIQFSKGQRLTATGLNQIQQAASQGIQSNSIFTNGKMVNLPSTVDARQIYSAPRLFDTRYFKTIYKWPGEQNVNQHLYICLVDYRQVAIREQGAYFSDETGWAKFAVMYENDNQVHLRVVSGQDFDLNTGLSDRRMSEYLSSYVPKTNYTGFVETPIQPNKDVHLHQLAILDENKLKLGTLFLIYANENNSPTPSAYAVNDLLGYVKHPSLLQTAAGFIKESSFTLIINQPDLSGSMVKNKYQNLVGAFTVDYVKSEPWEVMKRTGLISNPRYQIGCSQFTCDAYEDENYELHQLEPLSSGLSSNGYLSARYGTNYVVIDVPRLSAFHAWDAPDHKLSASPNWNPAFHVAFQVFQNSILKVNNEALSSVVTHYINRYPVAPCWQVYPF